jgi:hypothetical protein
VAKLELGLDGTDVCFACLSFVSFAVDEGDPREISRQLRLMTPDLWEDGLADPALAAVRSALERGVPDAAAALRDLEGHGGRSSTGRAIVLRLATELSRRRHEEMRVTTAARDQLGRAPPELN